MQLVISPHSIFSTYPTTLSLMQSQDHWVPWQSLGCSTSLQTSSPEEYQKSSQNSISYHSRMCLTIISLDRSQPAATFKRFQQIHLKETRGYLATHSTEVSTTLIHLVHHHHRIEWGYVFVASGYVVGIASVAWTLLCCRSLRERYFEKIEEIADKIFYERG